MPRSQRTQLNKRPIAEAKLGTTTSEAVRTVNMPTVTPLKSMGQSLAEAMGLAAKAGAGIYQLEADKQNKATASQHKIKGNNDGNTQALTDLEEIRKLPLLAQNDAITTASKKYFGSMSDSSSDFSDSYFSSNVQAYTQSMESADGKIRTAVNKEVQAANKTDAGNSILVSLGMGEKAETIISTNRDSSWTGTSAQKLDQYVDQTASYALAMQQTGCDTEDKYCSAGTFLIEPFIKDFLEIKAPNNGPSLLKNASTGDKIRKLRASLTGNGNKVFTENTKAYKQITKQLKLDESTTPDAFNKHLKEGALLGYYNDTAKYPEVANLQAEFQTKYTARQVENTTTALSDEEKDIESTLAIGEVYVKKEVEILLNKHTKILQKQVNMKLKTPQEAAKEIKDLLKVSNDNTTHKTVMRDFDINVPNNKDMTNLPAKTKTAMKKQVLDGLDKAREGKDYASLVDIANNNVKLSKEFITSQLPIDTTDIVAVTEGLALWKNIRRQDGGNNVLAPLASSIDQYYRMLELVRPLDKDQALSEAEINRVTRVIDRSGGRDFGIKLRDKYKAQEDIATAVADIPNRARDDIYSLYDYANEFMQPVAATEYITNVIQERFTRTVRRPKDQDNWLWGDDVFFINGAAFGDQGTTDEFAQLVMSDFTSKFDLAEKDLMDDVRITYDEDGDRFVIGHNSGGPGAVDLFSLPADDYRLEEK